MSEATWRRKVVRGCVAVRQDLEARVLSSGTAPHVFADNERLAKWATVLNEAPAGAAGKRRHEAVLDEYLSLADAVAALADHVAAAGPAGTTSAREPLDATGLKWRAAWASQLRGGLCLHPARPLCAARLQHSAAARPGAGRAAGAVCGRAGVRGARAAAPAARPVPA